MQFATPVQTRSHAEYMFVGWIHDLKYRCEGMDLEFEILATELHDEKVTEESLRFEVTVIDQDGKEETAFTEDSAKELVREARERAAGQSIRVKLWHWLTPVALPPLDLERIERRPPVRLRARHLKVLAGIMADVHHKENRIIMQDIFVRGILDAVFLLGLNLGEAKTEHEVRNMVLHAMGRNAPALPEPWEFEAVIEFAGGGEVVLLGEDLQRANAILTQEISRRKKLKLPLDCFLRRRRRNDVLITYIHPAPSRGGRKRKQTVPVGEWMEGAGN